eukprot:COSAG03_NODE_997_length_5056_cov_64.601369_5_plen_140_part_00
MLATALREIGSTAVSKAQYNWSMVLHASEGRRVEGPGAGAAPSTVARAGRPPSAVRPIGTAHVRGGALTLRSQCGAGCSDGSVYCVHACLRALCVDVVPLVRSRLLGTTICLIHTLQRIRGCSPSLPPLRRAAPRAYCR